MDAPVKECPPEVASNVSEHASLDTWTDDDTGDEELGQETFREENPTIPADADWSGGELDGEDSDDADLAVGGSRSGKRNYAETARMFKLRRNLDQLDCIHRQKEHNVLKAREELKACHLNMAEMEKQREEVEKEMEQLNGAESSGARFRLRAKHRRLCEELQQEEELEAHVSTSLGEHELELCQLEVEQGRFFQLRQEVQEEEQAYQTRQEKRGAARLQQEEKATRSLLRRTQHLQERQAAEHREEDARCQRALEEARINRKKAAMYLRETLKRMRRREAEEEKHSRQLIQRRTQAVMSLKASIAATQESLKTQHNRATANTQRQEVEEKQQRESLKAQGANSTRHMHQHKILQEFQRKKEEFEAKQKSKRVEIVTKLLLEEDLLERRKKHLAQLFPATPVGVGNSSGPGRTREMILQYLDLQPPQEKDKRVRRESELSESSSSSELSEQEDSTETRSPREEVQGPVESLAEPEFCGLWDQTHAVKVDEGAVAVKSIQDRAVEQNRNLPVLPKKAFHGKEIEGPPFISKPEILLFRDFDVGKTYKKKIFLTNVSYLTNYCKLLGVTSELMDFISVSFEPPGPMSPGMACELQAVFQPTINKDLDGEIQFKSAAGLFAVPVKCTIKTCDLEVDSRLVDFGTHVVGQAVTHTITLTNRGALGTDFNLVTPSVHSQAPDTTATQPPQGSSSLAGFSESQQSPSSQSPREPKSERTSGEPKSRGTSGEPKSGGTSGEPKSGGSSGEPKSGGTSGEASVTFKQNTSGAQTPAASEPVAPGPDCSLSSGDPLSSQKHEDLMDEGSSEISIGEVRGGHIGPFESVKLEVVFTPTIPGEATLDLHIQFSDPSSDLIPVRVRGVAECVPVCVAQPNIDLKICMFDRLYQDNVVIHNRANTALRITLEVCPQLENHLEILPKTGFIQAKSSFNAQLRFLPRCSLSEDARGSFDSETGVLEAPLTVQVADQARPIPFTVHAVVTSSDLRFDRTEVDFGHCSIYESVRSSVRLTNLSLLPQDFGFLKIPPFVEVQPNDGFGTLLPLETTEIHLVFSAKKAEDYSFQLLCKSGINRDFPVACRAVGVHPPLELSHSLVQFGATPVGRHSTAVLHVVNSHTSLNEFSHPVPRVGRGPIAPIGPRRFAFAQPESAEVSVTPMTGRVRPGQRCLVQVSFRPRLGDQEIREEAVRLLCQAEELRLQELEGASAAEAEAAKRSEQEPKKEAPSDTKKGKKAPATRPQGKQTVKEKNSKVSISPKTHSPFRPNPAELQPGSEEYVAGKASLLRSCSERSSRYVIPCFVSDVEPRQSELQAAEPTWRYTLNALAKWTVTEACSLLSEICVAASPLNTLYLELHCPAVRPPLVVTSNNAQNTIDFKQVAVDQKVVRKITLQNISKESLDLRSSVLDLSGPFSLLNALRRMGPGHTHTLLLSFTPALGKKYRETLEVRSAHMTVEVTLCGEGVEPVVTCSHQGALMDFGYVLEKESASQVFKLHNSSSLAMGFSVLLDSLSTSKGQGGADNLPVLITADPQGQVRPVVGTQNYSGLSVFTVSPIEGTIAPGKSQDVSVTFLPDHKSLHYSDRLTVKLMNKRVVCSVDLKGAARCHTMYLCGADSLTVPVDSLLPPPTSRETQVTALVDPVSSGVVVDSEKSPVPVLLTLRGFYREGAMCPAVRELEVGCIRSLQPMAKKNVEFLWENVSALQQRGFSIEPSKGTVDAGHRRTITVTWTPPSGLKPNEAVQVCAPLTLKGDDTEVYSVTLLALASVANN
ncbi:cilia- and flagella-associated protein 74 [Aplochiton taeniatus]